MFVRPGIQLSRDDLSTTNVTKISNSSSIAIDKLPPGNYKVQYSVVLGGRLTQPSAMATFKVKKVSSRKKR